MPPTDLSRRAFVAALAASAASVAAPAAALEPATARALVDRVLADVVPLINSGRTAEEMFPAFERIFATYADVPAIARAALGPVARTLPAADFAAYEGAFRIYMARKYGRRFREFIGGRIEVTGAAPLGRHAEVRSMVEMTGWAPFEMLWHVAEVSGRPLFFNLIIEGVNMLAVERTEIQAMLAARGGDVGRLVQDLAQA